MKRSKALAAAAALGVCLLVAAYLVHQRVPMLWTIPPPPSRALDTTGWTDAEPLSAARVLYVGHSAVGPHIPGMAAAIAESLGASYVADSQLIDGGSLERNWHQGESATGVRARERLETGEYDVVIFTEALNLDAMIRWSDSPGYLRRWSDLAREHRADVRLYMYETWHDRRNRRFELGVFHGGTWRENLDADLGTWEYIVDEAERAGPPLGIQFAPSGQAMAALHDAIGAGEIDGLESMEELFLDSIHPNPRGFYFVALVHVATVLRRSPVGATRVVPLADGGELDVPGATASAMQTIAWRVARQYPRSGVRLPPR